MPFTPSHVAAVLPLISSARLRRILDPWALALGAMTPDLPIFFSFLPDYTIWHSLQGILTIDPFAVVVMFVLFHGLLRDPLIALLPQSLVGRAASLAPKWQGLRRLPAVIAGGVVGAATHKLWDSFTHSYGQRVWGWEWLSEPAIGPLPTFRVLQYLSTVVGLAVVLWWTWCGLSRMEPVTAPERLLLSVPVRRGVLLATVAATLMGAAVWPRIYPPSGRAELITRMGAGVVVGCCALLIAYAVMWQLRRAMTVSQRA
ncbi:DUF4184 family protein [Streptosporangium carneum]|uniref:DUF4184 domain-containing protein n=1 Tax=Streptosporangium carneum TaxID=47481 RepID=A0A9W6MGW3_9ACTN|nr:DUF4184 family protein [Streptosporangium carneum]GLK13542.1 hypothetical protein GCM10017600_69530 [Streptosporangium carneum]